MSYNQFAWYYDSLMEPQFYVDYFHYIQTKASLEDVLELGCGTGTMAIMIKDIINSYQGVDLSSDMIEIAKKDCHVNHMTFEVADMTKFKTNKTFDTILCLCDSLNYVLEFENQIRVLKNCFECLKPGGTLIFDIHSQHKIQQTFHDYFEEEENEDFYFYWSVKQTDTYQITHYVVIEDLNEDVRMEEKHIQESFPKAWYENALHEMGFIEVTQEDVFKDGERHVFVARKG